MTSQEMEYIATALSIYPTRPFDYKEWFKAYRIRNCGMVMFAKV